MIWRRRTCPSRAIRLTEGQFFQGTSERLGEHEVDEDDLVCQETAIRDEILPTSILKPDGVDERREEAGQTAEQLEERDTVGSLGEGPYFNHVGYANQSVLGVFMRRWGFKGESKELTVGQRVITKVVGGCVGKDEEDDGTIGSLVRSTQVPALHSLLHGDRPEDVDGQGRYRASEVHVATLEPEDEERGDRTAHQVPAREGNVDLLLEYRLVLADHLEEVAQEIGDQRVAGPLREETQHAADERAPSHPGRFHHVLPGHVRVLELELDRRLHLRELGLHELGLAVSLPVVLD